MTVGQPRRRISSRGAPGTSPLWCSDSYLDQEVGPEEREEDDSGAAQEEYLQQGDHQPGEYQAPALYGALVFYLDQAVGAEEREEDDCGAAKEEYLRQGDHQAPALYGAVILPWTKR